MLGVMSGRLSQPINNKIQAFPYSTWRNEFEAARKLGFECLEWIFEIPNMEVNPILSDAGINELKNLSQKTGVMISSMVADNFMFERMYGDNQSEVKRALNRLELLINQSSKAGIPILELPLMGRASIKEPSNRKDFVANIRPYLKLAAEKSIVLSLELDLPPHDFKKLLLDLNHHNIGVNYDMGNSAAFGFEAKEEISLLGKYIVNVHIKDGIRGGGTVPLGTGHTDFTSVMKALRKSGYQGDYIFQSAREDLNEVGQCPTPEETLTGYLNFIRAYFEN